VRPLKIVSFVLRLLFVVCCILVLIQLLLPAIFLTVRQLQEKSRPIRKGRTEFELGMFKPIETSTSHRLRLLLLLITLVCLSTHTKSTQVH
jgi:uncharacterized membrane protein YhaH (DUF805 family)